MSITGIAVPPETVEVMKALRARKHRFVVLTIGANNTQIVVRRTGSRDAIYEDLFTSATDGDAGDDDDVPWSVEPCYIAIDWEMVVEGRARDKLLLIQYVPDTAPPKSRMLYSGSREALLDACCDGFLTMQANDISDLERSEINRKLKISS